MKIAYCFFIALIFSNVVFAQQTDSSGKKKTKNGKYFSMGTGGIKVGTDSSFQREGVFDVQYGMLDLGLNKIQDKTNYNSAGAQNFLHTDASYKNANLFDLNQGKSINVNIYPVMVKYRLLNNPGQKIYLVSGLGLQIYNFRFTKNITYVNNSSSYVIMDTVNFKKNKLAFDYLNVPLELLLKTRLTKKHSLVYGFGITEGFLLNSWTKQESGLRGKQKDHNNFDFSNFNTCLMGEIGVTEVARLYFTYQVTSLATGGLDQHPFCIGLRLLGI